MIQRMTFEFEYLGKFEFTFENILGYKTESKRVEKKNEVENLVHVYL